MIDVGVFEPEVGAPHPWLKPDAAMNQVQKKQWQRLARSSSYGGLVAVAQDASKLGHLRRRVPELGGAK
jgi:hypothetical protein